MPLAAAHDVGGPGITYTGGYVLPSPPGGEGMFPLPELLEVAAIETVAFWWQLKSEQGLYRIENAGAYKEIADTRGLPWVRTVLRKFRRTGA